MRPAAPSTRFVPPEPADPCSTRERRRPPHLPDFSLRCESASDGLSVVLGPLRGLTRDVYQLDRESTRRPYLAEKVGVVRDGFSPRSLDILLGPEVLHILNDPRAWILRPDSELAQLQDEDYPTPYSDPALKRPRELNAFIHKLHQIGTNEPGCRFITFRRRCKARVGVFIVAKKDDSLRLVFDCRVANLLHRAPPTSECVTAGAFASLDFSEEEDIPQGLAPVSRN
jgi:hypothetical protein